ncbi:hypothetical protein ACLMAJ_13705 [Nocardia sp. KC 131]|uniref:hypothetical protein n=1 Tax=Nocardia arseniciresistens TaxID=3392119 RepID=UPI00398E9485
MVTAPNSQRCARAATALAAIAAASILATAPAHAANTVDITSAAPSSVEVDYNCEATAGVTSLQVMAGEPTTDRPAAIGAQNNLTCDGTQQVATVALTAAGGEPPLAQGAGVQVRAALVDQSDVVVSGQAKVLTLE